MPYPGACAADVNSIRTVTLTLPAAPAEKRICCVRTPGSACAGTLTETEREPPPCRLPPVGETERAVSSDAAVQASAWPVPPAL